MARIATASAYAALAALLLSTSCVAEDELDMSEMLSTLFGALSGAASGGEGGGASGCVYKCPGGGEPKHRDGHEPTHNGCGSYGLEVTGEFDFTECCNVHDRCYDLCGTSRAQCDKEFDVCMKKHCKTLKDKERARACRTNAGIYYVGATAFGCETFLASQENASWDAFSSDDDD